LINDLARAIWRWTEKKEVPSETKSEIKARYKSSKMCKMSDPELWMHFNFGEDSPDPSKDRISESKSALQNAIMKRILCSQLINTDLKQSGTKQRQDT
jgi:hypothetical protein